MSKKIDAVIEQEKDRLKERIRAFQPKNKKLLNRLFALWEGKESVIKMTDAISSASVAGERQVIEILDVLTVMLRLENFTYEVDGENIRFHFPKLEEIL